MSVSGTRSRWASEDGVALVFTLLATLIISGLAIVMLSRTVNQQRATGNARDYEAAVHVAEAAADGVIIAMNNDRAFITVDGAGNPVPYDLGIAATPAQQRAWAIDRATALSGVAGMVVTSGTIGQSIAIRPVDDVTLEPLNVIYSVAFLPSVANVNEIRVLRIGFDQNQFSPGFALLSHASIQVNGSNNSGVFGALGNIHTNGNLVMNGETVDGIVSASGTITGDTSKVTGTPPPSVRPNQPLEPVPDIVPREQWQLSQTQSFQKCYFYDDGRVPDGNPQACGSGRGGGPILWYDLCPDGTARFADGSGPCEGTVRNTGTPARFNGWKYSNGVWSVQNAVNDGVYYAYCANTVMRGGDASVTVIAEDPDSPHPNAAMNAACASNDTSPTNVGNFELNGNACLTSATSDMLFVAGRDVKVNGGAGGGCSGPGQFAFEGLIAAREQMDIRGSGSLRGASIATDASSASAVVTANKFGGSFKITYDTGIRVPFSALVRTTSWTEL